MNDARLRGTILEVILEVLDSCEADRGFLHVQIDRDKVKRMIDHLKWGLPMNDPSDSNKASLAAAIAIATQSKEPDTPRTPMNDDLRAAAERLGATHGVNWNQQDWVMARMICKAYLAEHPEPADTGPPVGWTIISWTMDSLVCESPDGRRRRYETEPMADAAEIAKLREIRELLETAVEAWERCIENRTRVVLQREWRDKAAKLIQETER